MRRPPRRSSPCDLVGNRTGLTYAGGIEFLPDGSFLVSDQPNDRIAWVSADRRTVETLVEVGKPADFGIDLTRGRLYVPCFTDGTVTVFELGKR